MLTGRDSHGAVLVLVAISVGVGAAWEMLEFAVDHLNGPPRVVGPAVRVAECTFQATGPAISCIRLASRFEGLQAGVLVWEGAGTHRADDNQVVVRLIGSRFEGTATTNLGAVGRQGGPGENNHVRIFVHGATDTKGMLFVAFHALRSCGVNNRVEVMGNPEAWERNPEMLPHEP